MRRTRAALLGAATALVSARGTANVPVSDIADAAGVSRQLVYLHYGDRDTLLLEAALDLARRELAEHGDDAHGEDSGRDRALAIARHFAAHQDFYRAMFATANAFALGQVVGGLLSPLRCDALLARYGEAVPAGAVEDFAVFVTGGGTALMAAWLESGEEPLDPEAMADRLQSISGLLTTAVEAHAGRA
ncbi:TetR family transcriptional regulator [Glycomyces tritici]|uniref:TetR family transcriptional regulator n=1 Tax=Glycomyces tritici TaxID=2665176 RepID=A0ABT7YLN4_9ACTN|nr:TetR family transcriptional regulator [Glycomyces tritici]MDN3239507.1 TetR family transcriptional regulator [Glycomyces tritici]